MSERWTAEAISARIAGREWYHSIDLGHGVTTSGLPFDPIWENIRRVRSTVDYVGKRVLDLASWDGMWAFEAEQAGATEVTATEVFPLAYENFLLCREILDSKVMPYYNTSIYNLWDSLASIIDYGRPEYRLFDIVQNFGLMYHLRDPLYALAATRSVLKTGGLTILETAVVLDEPKSFMLLNGYPNPPRIYPDPTTWWAITLPCLEEMLQGTLFRQIHCETISQLVREDGTHIGRATVVAEAIHPRDSGLPETLLTELLIAHRSPGVHLDRLK